MKRVSLYIDLAFCLAFLPLMLLAFPVERMWAGHPVFFCSFVTWLYAAYFIYGHFIVPGLFEKSGRLKAIIVLAVTILITLLFSAYDIRSPLYAIRKQFPETAASWGIRLNRQAVWIHFIIVVTFSFAVGILKVAFRQKIALKELEHNRDNDRSPAGNNGRQSTQMLLKSDYRTVAVPFENIVYIESIDNYVKLHLRDGGSVQSRITLTSVWKMLPPGDFLRIHRSFIVRKDCVSDFTRSDVTLAPISRTLPIGKTYAASALSVLEGGKCPQCP
ncbi:MAG: LytR/AlgR family response regulator transcription factor [Candidatus Cryptobacteroides sp.]